MGTKLLPNNSFKPKPLRYAKHMADIACHVFRSTTRLGLTLALGVMAVIPRVLKAASLLAGAFLAFVGSSILLAVGSGDVRVGEQGATFMGVAFLAVAAPCVVYPFSSRLASLLLALALLGFAVAMLWLAFGADAVTGRVMMFQAAAGAFAVILVLRFWLVYRRRPRVGDA